MDTADTQVLHSALDDLVARSVLTADQARAVLAACAAHEQPGSTPARGIRRGAPLARLLVESAAYLGAALVAASAVAYVLQRWETLPQVARLALLLGIGALGLIAGALVVRLAGGPRAWDTRERSSQRRLASVLLAFGSVAVGAAAGQLLPDPLDVGWRTDVSYAAMLSALVVLALVVLAQRFAPSAVTELVMFGSSLALVTSLCAWTYPQVPEDVGGIGASPPPARWYEYTAALAVLVLGLLWAGLVARRLTLPLLATCVGLAASFLAAASLAADDRTRGPGLALLGLLALGGIGSFVLVRSWPWLALTVASTTAVVFFAVLGSGDAPVAFLASGLVLLAGSGLAAWLGRRTASRSSPVEDCAERGGQRTTRTSDRSGT